MQTEASQLLTVDEVVKATRLSSRTIRRAAKQGSLPVVRFGRTVRVQSADLAAFIEQHRCACTDPIAGSREA